MRLVDYFRLGWANIVAHKKRAAIVVMIVGVMFGVLIAGSLLIQGGKYRSGYDDALD